MKEQFYNDLQNLYSFINQQKEDTNNYFKWLENNNSENLSFIDSFLTKIEIPITNETRLAVITRLVSLHEDKLIQTFKHLVLSEEKIRVNRNWCGQIL